MAGIGRAPKDPSKRARTNSDPIPLRVVQAAVVSQPELPSFDVQVTVDDQVITQEFQWPEITRRWWQMWGDSPLSADYTETDWSFLLDTALIHARYWNGAVSVAAELRLRVAKFGATPEDRDRLRITFASADGAEQRQVTSPTESAQEHYSGLKLADE